MVLRTGLTIGLGIALAGNAWVGDARAETRTLQQALAAAYSGNPTLQAARAQLRAVDENVPQALAGWRPQVSIAANAGYADGNVKNHIPGSQFQPVAINQYSSNNRGLNQQQLSVTQPLWTGGQTAASTHRAENQVMGQRARLIASEQQVFTDAINAFVSVIGNTQVLALNVNNEQVLTRQLQATNDRFRVGEITRTDVAQAEAALAGATATRQTSEGNVQNARSQFLRVVGDLPGALVEPQPLRLPVRSLEQAKSLAAGNNPTVIAAMFDDSAAKDNFDIQYSKLMPNLSLQGSLARLEDVQIKNSLNKEAQILAAITIPIYQGGAEYAAIRQARQQQQQARSVVDDARRTAIEQVSTAWENYNSAKSTIDSTRAQIRANQIALEGVQREAIVGSRTTLDVLNAEQALLNSRVTLVQNLANLVNASYAIAAAVGRLTARDLNLDVPLYDDTAYYQSVRNRWIGTGDFATNQPGR
jgi:outer membrane protein